MRKQRASQIYKLMTYETDNLRDQIHHVLKESTEFLHADLGIISEIKRNSYTVIDYYSTSPAELKVGQEFELGNTYCSITYDEDGIVDINHMGASEYNGHPCYELFGLETYIGVPIWIRGKRFGTLNFSSASPRKTRFDDFDYDFVFIMGQLISTALTRSMFETELIGKNEVLKDQNSKLEQLMESNRSMNHMMVHDLKGPINNIKILTQMMKAGGAEKGNKLNFNHLDRELNKSLQLINELNYINKLEFSEAPLEYQSIDLSNLVGQIAENYSAAASTKNIELSFDIPDEEMVIETDVLALTRIIDNLVSNAIKFTPLGKMVRIALDKTEDGVSLRVIDQGPGFTELDRSRLFKKFQMLSAKPTNKEVSTGLGLSIVKLLADKLGYKIFVKSEEKRGSEFILQMKARKEELAS